MIIQSDCMEAMRDLIAKGIQVDSIVTDPPYELGFMGKDWDRTGIAYSRMMWKLCFDLLKPGGHLLAFGGSRTYHRMACAIEDAGFEVRDQIMWIYGQGFPKSLDISKAIDKMAGAEREVIGEATRHGGGNSQIMKGDYNPPLTAPATDAAKQWQGFGTALKPAHEPIVLARKPLSEKTIAANVLKHGTGGINIDRCRVGNESTLVKRSPNSLGRMNDDGWEPKEGFNGSAQGRFPANLIHDGSDEVEEEFAKYGEKKCGAIRPHHVFRQNKENSVTENGLKEVTGYDMPANTGTASRFFYCAKASKKDRNGSKHPTVKPLALMRYLCRLITPPGGTVLDPFAGSGTTGQAAIEEGFSTILIEKESEYIADIERRLVNEL
jgi:DNA modification methylase